jgi:hypothetical protein
MHVAKTMADRFVAGHKLSARHPIVFGVSPWARKLASIQTGKTSHEKKKEAWSCQIYQAMKAPKASGSTRFRNRTVEGFIRWLVYSTLFVRVAEVEQLQCAFK